MRVDWEGTKRNYEAGVDRGVLYFFGAQEEAVSWNGLISVNKQVQVASATPRYFDGIVFNLEQKNEDYVANVEAYVYPYMLEDHILALMDSRTLVGESPELQPFGFTYRTLTAEGYKIHLVYNVTVVVNPITYVTIGDSVNLQPFKFIFHTVPVDVPNARPTSHFILDSERTDESVLSSVEDVLYGTTGTSPHFPSVDELVSLFTAGEGGS